MADNKYDPEKLFNDLLHHEWYGAINLASKKFAHRIPPGSNIQHEDLIEAGLYALHNSIANWNKEKHGPFTAYARSTISNGMKQAIRENQPVDRYFHDKFIAPSQKSKVKASEVKEIKPEDLTQQLQSSEVSDAIPDKPKLP